MPAPDHVLDMACRYIKQASLRRLHAMVNPITTYIQVTQKRMSWHAHGTRRDDKNIEKEVTTMNVGAKRP